MTADNGQEFKYGYDSQSGKYGYYVAGSGGADTFIPFSSITNAEIIQQSNITATFTDTTHAKVPYPTGYNKNTAFLAAKEQYRQDEGKFVLLPTTMTDTYQDDGVLMTVVEVSTAVFRNNFNLVWVVV